MRLFLEKSNLLRYSLYTVKFSPLRHRVLWICTHLYGCITTTTIKIWSSYITPKSCLVLIWSQPLYPVPTLSKSLICFLSLYFCLYQNVIQIKIIQCVPLSLAFFSPHNALGFIHVVSCIDSSPLYTPLFFGWVAFHRMGVPTCIYPIHQFKNIWIISCFGDYK